MIARIWHGAVKATDGDIYAAYLLGADGRIPDYTDVPGNLGAWVLRKRADEKDSFVMFSLWDSIEALKAYAGDNPEKAVFYETDERLLIERDEVVAHFEVVGRAVPKSE